MKLITGTQCPVAVGVLAHITSQTASSRMLAALTAMAWVKEASSGGPQKHAEISKQLVEALKRPKADRGPEGKLQCYPELAALYSQAHNATVRLLMLVSTHDFLWEAESPESYHSLQACSELAIWMVKEWTRRPVCMTVGSVLHPNLRCFLILPS